MAASLQTLLWQGSAGLVDFIHCLPHGQVTFWPFCLHKKEGY